jgi:hypothetical protein
MTSYADGNGFLIFILTYQKIILYNKRFRKYTSELKQYNIMVALHSYEKMCTHRYSPRLCAYDVTPSTTSGFNHIIQKKLWNLYINASQISCGAVLTREKNQSRVTTAMQKQLNKTASSPELSSQSLFPHKLQEHYSPSAVAIYHPSMQQ